MLARGDREPLIAELPDDVEGLAYRLLEREAELVLRHRPLDFRADVRRRLEESVCRDQAVERLVWPLEVVVSQEVGESVLRVDRVREHRPPQKLVP